MPQPLVEYKKACDSGKREVLYDTLIDFCIPPNLFDLIKMCWNDNYDKSLDTPIFAWYISIHIICFQTLACL